MRFIMKGGVWKNTEDEILKAAVMKYGKNQWGRISSLLVRKTAKQCKARWYEWLDPSIKKTEWSREEEEKLLHLAKTMPNQWRTIAPLVGRTAAQCLQHYEKLLDAAQERDEDGGDSKEAKDDPRKLRPGEIDPAPESRVPRPDPIDMDEDEKEMLNEARARMANTKGKKAKRKAREKQLMEAKRLASLQKRRELKAAGIEMRSGLKKKRKNLDYNAEIPFERQAPAGFYDTSAEAAAERAMRAEPDFLHKTLHELDGKRRADAEEEERKREAKKQKLMKEFLLPQYMAQIHKLTDPDKGAARPKLSLPAPQISDADLSEIARISASGAAAAMGGATPTRALLANYGAATPAQLASGGAATGSFLGGMTPARTPLALPTPQRTQSTGDALLAEARAQMALSSMETPLKGGVMPDVAFTPKITTPARTPSLAGATPRLGTASRSGAAGATPRLGGGQTPSFASAPATPSSEFEDSGAVSAAASVAMRRRQASLKSTLKLGLSALPAPRNEAVLAGPVAMDDEDDKPKKAVMEEDMADVLHRERAQAAAEEVARLRRRSQVLQRDLPRPVQLSAAVPPRPSLPVSVSAVPSSSASSDMQMVDDGEEDEAVRRAELRSASALVAEEMARLLASDVVQYPLPGVAPPRKAAAPLEPLADQELQAARLLVHRELAALLAALPADYAARRADVFAATWERVHQRLLYSPSRRAWVSADLLAPSEQAAALKAEWAALCDLAASQARANAKTEAKLRTLLQGYAVRAEKSGQALDAGYGALDEAAVQLGCFRVLADQEAQAIPARVTALRRELAAASEVEAELQQRYADRLREQDALLRQLRQLEQGQGQGVSQAQGPQPIQASFVRAATA